jgi:hypothetical protein
MRDPAFRRSQLDGLRLPHVAPVNALVDELRGSGRGWVPYIAPIYGGVDARMLSVLRDPGPGTNDASDGSGFLCLENDDATAERFATLLDEAGISPAEMVPWNAYPWFINRRPRTGELDAGIEPLRRLVELLPRLRVVMLNGIDAQTAWRRYARRHPATVQSLVVIATYHTSPQALWTSDLAVREGRLRRLKGAFVEARNALD